MFLAWEFMCKFVHVLQQQVRVIARAGTSTWSSWDWALPLNFKIFFAFIGLQIEMGHSLEFLSLHFPYEHSERFLTIFFLCAVSISVIVNAKKSRNSIGKTRAMETHLYTMQFLFSCTRTFLWTWRTIPYYFFFYIPVRISIIMNAHT